MSTQVQLRRGSTAQHESFTSALAEVTVNVDTHALHVHDGSTAGGFATAAQGAKADTALQPDAAISYAVTDSAALKAVDVTRRQVVSVKDPSISGEFFLRAGTMPRTADDANFIASGTNGYYWERLNKQVEFDNFYIGAWFRSDDDATMDFYTSTDLENFTRINNGGVRRVKTSFVGGGDQSMLFWREFFYSMVTWTTDGFCDFAIYRTRHGAC